MLSAKAYISGELRDIPRGGGFGDVPCLRTYFSCYSCSPAAQGGGCRPGAGCSGTPRQRAREVQTGWVQRRGK